METAPPTDTKRVEAKLVEQNPQQQGLDGHHEHIERIAGRDQDGHRKGEWDDAREDHDGEPGPARKASCPSLPHHLKD